MAVVSESAAKAKEEEEGGGSINKVKGIVFPLCRPFPFPPFLSAAAASHQFPIHYSYSYFCPTHKLIAAAEVINQSQQQWEWDLGF